MRKWNPKEINGLWYPYDNKRRKKFVDWDDDTIYFHSEKECEEWCEARERIENAFPI